MTEIRQDSGSLRSTIDTALDRLILDLRQSGWSSGEIRKELHKALDRVLPEQG